MGIAAEARGWCNWWIDGATVQTRDPPGDAPMVERRTDQELSVGVGRRRRTARPQLRSIARRQFGVFTAAQAREAGCDKHALRNWQSSGEIQSRGGGLWAFTTAPDDARHEAMSRLLRNGPDAAVALHSAAALWDLRGFSVRPVQVIRLRGGAKRPGGGRHTSTRFHDGHVTVIEGLRITTPGRTLFDLAGRLHPERVERLVDTCLSRRLTTVRDLAALLDDLQGRGRPGIQLMRSIIDARLDPSYQPTDSNLERRFEEILRDAGIRGFARQVLVGDPVGLIGRVDYVHRGHAVIAEIQSELHHRSLLDQRKDAERLSRLRSDGWIVVEIHEHDVWHAPRQVTKSVQAAIRLARARR
jgi:very-short-patch-repair endonuclease